MRTRCCLLLILCLASVADAQGKVSTFAADWRDAGRNRTVPVKVYHPADGKGPWPVVIVSHGLGGSREGMAYFGNNLAASGYVAVHPTHTGSDSSLLRGGTMNDALPALQRAMTLEQATARCDDVHFVIDELERLNQAKQGALSGKLDLDRIAMAGHSFGAVTTLWVCGQVFPVKPTTLADPRVKCGIALSPSPPKGGADPKTAFAQAKIPILHMTGTHDTTPLPGDADAPERRIPFDHMQGSDQYLVILTGGDHMIFGGATMRRRLRGGNDGEAFLEVIEKTAVAFLDAYLKQDAKQKTWLQNDAKTFIGKNGTFEMKLKN